MNAVEWQKIKEIFNATIDLSETERVAVLQNCDANLRREVEKLHKSHRQAKDFINEPALVEIGLVDEKTFDNTVGKQVDSYKILEEIGHGGMGTVYLAARADDFEKRVALKLIRRGMDTNSVLKRFVMERQILARLEHPFIARLLDGGSTTDGLPYFVMEYVAGLPVTKFCDARDLNITERLELFQKICAAVAYAHQNLVVHRDIKPSNILVTEDGTPKLLDFGIAKLLNPDWSLDTNEATATMFRVMTPEYASPEQLRGLPVTTVSDVYSLGVVLYELLSGQRPYKIESCLPEEVARIVFTAEPLRPSAAASRETNRDDARATNEDQRPKTRNQSENPKSQIPNPKSLRGDLDNIILKALRKEPERRYASVQEFAEDIRRHLSGLPVTATADTVSYRVKKFVRRHRASVFAATLIALTLVSATAITAWQSVVAKRERDRAEHRFKQVRKLANTVLFEYHDGIEKLSGSTAIREKMVRDAVEYLDNLSAESAGDAELQRELAAAYQKVGDVQGNPYLANLGDQPGALDSYQKALAIREALSAQTPHDAQTQINLAVSYGKVGDILWAKGESANAQGNYRKALAIYENLASENNLPASENYSFVQLYIRIGQALQQSGDFSGALENYQKSLSKAEKLGAVEPSNAKYRRGVAVGYFKSGDVFHLTQKYAQALDNFQKSAAIFEQLAADASNAAAQRDLTVAFSRIAAAQTELGEYENALENNRRTIAIQEKLVAADPNNLQIHFDIADTYASLADNFGRMRRFTEAEESFRRTINIFSERLAKNPNYSQARSHYARAYLLFAKTLLKKGDADAALENYRNALAVLEVESVRSEVPDKLAEACEGAGDAFDFLAQKETGKKAQHLREAVASYQKSLEIRQDLERRGKANANKSNEIAQKITKCENALAKL